VGWWENSACTTGFFSDSGPTEAQTVMNADRIVARFIEQALSGIHGARRRMLGAVVWAAMSGSMLSLSRLARGMTRSGGSCRAALERVDRLVGSARVAQDAEEVARALLARLCRWLSPLVIAVDGSAATPGGTFVELRAAVVWLGMGRGLTVSQRVYAAALQGNGKTERALLRDLSRWVPKGTRVIVISDAGFRTPWFRAMERLGWGWIGRVRRGNQVRHGDGVWQDAVGWAHRAPAQAWRLADARLTQSERMACDLVRVKRLPTGRRRHRCPGHGPSPKADAEARTSAREPWVLAHSTGLRDLRADEIVTRPKIAPGHVWPLDACDCFEVGKAARVGHGGLISPAPPGSLTAEYGSRLTGAPA